MCVRDAAAAAAAAAAAVDDDDDDDDDEESMSWGDGIINASVAVRKLEPVVVEAVDVKDDWFEATADAAAVLSVLIALPIAEATVVDVWFEFEPNDDDMGRHRGALERYAELDGLLLLPLVVELDETPIFVFLLLGEAFVVFVLVVVAVVDVSIEETLLSIW